MKEDERNNLELGCACPSQPPDWLGKSVLYEPHRFYDVECRGGVTADPFFNGRAIAAGKRIERADPQTRKSRS